MTIDQITDRNEPNAIDIEAAAESDNLSKESTDVGEEK
jgi:hypothetical protein